MFDHGNHASDETQPAPSTAPVHPVSDPVQVPPSAEAIESTPPDAGGLSDAALLARAVELEQARNRLDVEEAGVLAELDARGTCDREHGLHTAAWLAREATLSSSVARGRVKVATTLARHLPGVLDAVQSGRIGWEHARVIAHGANPRIVDLVAERADELIGLADHCLFDRWRAEIHGLFRLWDQDGSYDPNEDPASDRLTHGSTLDGLTSLSATLTDHNGQVVTQAIEARADELFRRATADHQTTPDLPVPSRSTLRALALVELIRDSLGVDLASSKGPKVDVTLVVNAADPTVASTPDGVRLADGTTRLLLCDPELSAVVLDRRGVPLDLGRRVRLVQDAQRRGVRTRDGGCVFPGCTAKASWCDVHHCVHWHDGGLTDLCNLVSLCRHHHGTVHRTGWSVRLSDDGWAIFRGPSAEFWGQRHGRTRAGPLPDST